MADNVSMANATSTDTGQSTEHLAQLRRLLRQREYRRAIETIDRWMPADADAGSPVSIEDVRTYAYEQLVKHGPGPTRVNLRRGIPVSLRRPITVDLRRLSGSALERVLRWLLAGELRAAEAALRADDYADAVTAAELAARIDDRCTRMALLHARALYEVSVAALKGHNADLDEVSGKLHRATRLALRAATDPTLSDPHKKLSVALDDVTAIVERRRVRTARADAVMSVVRRFYRLVEHYNDKDQIVSQVQLGNARASLAQIRADVERLSREHPADTPAGQILVDLRGQCVRYKAYLERVSRSARIL
jgi:hypothetical protein